LLEHVHVDYYGSQVPLSQVANITVLDARTLGVSVWEKKMATVVDKAIREADLGLNPIATGELIRVPMPPLSEERRKELVKLVKGEAEHAKVAVRNLRRDANEQYKKLLKDKAMSEDEERRAQDDVQKLTDRFVADIDKLIATKEQELMAV
jgi:ribosome recycling factor